MNSRVPSIANFGSRARIIRKKRLRLASSKAGTLNTGWYGCGNPQSASVPITAVSAANRMVVSKAGTMNEGRLTRGRPPMLSG